MRRALLVPSIFDRYVDVFSWYRISGGTIGASGDRTPDNVESEGLLVFVKIFGCL